ncbi:MAG: winged helix DNA-binding protein [Candidatus Heimdallarchaeota archaeon]|nr:winged helix DNA-binding protein [Candidatus Heimdallarchaeota archaeon]
MIGVEEMKKPDFYVIARFLERLWREGHPMKKTRLAMSIGVNYDVFSKYLSWLEKRGLVERVKDERGKEVVRITERGKESYHNIVSWMHKFFYEAAQEKL